MTKITKDDLLKHQKTCNEVCDQAVALLYPFAQTYESAANAVRRINTFRDKWPTNAEEFEHIAQYVGDCISLFGMVSEELDDWIERPRTMGEAVGFYVQHLLGETIQGLPVPPYEEAIPTKTAPSSTSYWMRTPGTCVSEVWVTDSAAQEIRAEWETAWPDPNSPRYRSRCWPISTEQFYADYYDTFIGWVSVGGKTGEPVLGRGYAHGGKGDVKVVAFNGRTASVYPNADVKVLFTPDQAELLETLFGGKPTTMAEKTSR